jgi:hypothetical protein
MRESRCTLPHWHWRAGTPRRASWPCVGMADGANMLGHFVTLLREMLMLLAHGCHLLWICSRLGATLGATRATPLKVVIGLVIVLGIQVLHAIENGQNLLLFPLSRKRGHPCHTRCHCD